MLAVAILIVLIATLICFYKGLKDKNIRNDLYLFKCLTTPVRIF